MEKVLLARPELAVAAAEGSESGLSGWEQYGPACRGLIDATLTDQEKTHGR